MLEQNISKRLLNLFENRQWDEVISLWDKDGAGKLLPYTTHKSLNSFVEKARGQLGGSKENDKKSAFLTVVTINYNNLEGLKRTAESVFKQTRRDLIQYIVVDGNSVDGSLDYLSKVEQKIDVPTFGSDRGVYDAMNRGLEFAKSDFTLFLNSGDCFVDEFVVEKLYQELAAHPESPVAAYGSTLLSSGSRWPSKSTREIWKGMICSHQSIIIDTDFMKSIGFNLGYKIVADFETIYRACLSERPICSLSFDISQIEDVGISSDFVTRTLERWLVVKSHPNPDVSVEEIDQYYERLLHKEISTDKQVVEIKPTKLPPENSKDLESRLIFLISMPRSGSTMLQKILESSPAIGTVAEPWVMLPLLSMYDPDLIEAQYIQNLSIKAGENFLSEIGHPTLFAEAQRNYADTVFHAAISKLGTERFLDKTPRYVHIVDKLADLYPNAKFLVLLRNPASIISSYTHTWAGSDYEKTASKPEFLHDFGHGFQNLADFVASGRKNMHVVRYEELVSNPELVASDIYNYLGLPFSNDYLSYGKNAPQNPKKYAFGDPVNVYKKGRPDASHAERWIKDNTGNPTIDTFRELVAGVSDDAMNKLGYSKSVILNKIGEMSDGSLDVIDITKRNAPEQLTASNQRIPTFGYTLGVLIACYNNEATIAQCLSSVINQSKKPDLVVVTDDCSSDRSVEIVRQFIADNPMVNIQLNARPENVGVAKNRDTAIRGMDVDFITTLDGDDYFIPGKLEAEWLALKGRKKHVAISDIVVSLPKGGEEVLNTEAYHLASQRDISSYLLTRRFPVPRDMMFSKSLFLKAEGFDHGVSIYEDWAFKLRLIYASKDSGWVHSGVKGIIYDRRSPGLSGKPPIVHAFGETMAIARNIDRLSSDNVLVSSALRSAARHLKGNTKLRADEFTSRLARRNPIPEAVITRLNRFWDERDKCQTYTDMANHVWQLYSLKGL